jgi:hypothetical protein
MFPMPPLRHTITVAQLAPLVLSWPREERYEGLLEGERLRTL